jgi:hypothetical protein
MAARDRRSDEVNRLAALARMFASPLKLCGVGLGRDQHTGAWFLQLQTGARVYRARTERDRHRDDPLERNLSHAPE